MDGLPGITEIRLLDLDQPIRTLDINVVPWRDGDGDAAPRAAPVFSSPRRFARTMAGNSRAPVEIGNWVLDGDADRQDYAFVLWREIAADALRRSLVNEIYDVHESTRVVLAGSPTRRLRLGVAQATASTFAELSEAARWVFASAGRG
ncbi:hypothetical protein [Sphingomonas sp. AAP5]|uniref:hypothetical protein n=1 Tax=Sphingomonas sp. AAP5 TaxID=1523415 RepID=UPI0014044A0F|nr:hypothetical protein [Sphingomonas sp. AAP5]